MRFGTLSVMHLLKARSYAFETVRPNSVRVCSMEWHIYHQHHPAIPVLNRMKVHFIEGVFYCKRTNTILTCLFFNCWIL